MVNAVGKNAGRGARCRSSRKKIAGKGKAKTVRRGGSVTLFNKIDLAAKDAIFPLMNRRLAAFFLLLIFGLIPPLRAVETDAALADDHAEAGYSDVAVFTNALQLIRQDYVDEKKTGYHDLIYSALRGMLSELDPHSQFMPPQDFKGMQDDTRSQFGGLGVVVAIRDGRLTIVTPMEDTPGAQAGLLPGDQILKINGNWTEQMELSEAVQQLRGEVGEKVTLTIWRISQQEMKDFIITRDIVRVASVKGAKTLPRELTGGFKIGYIRITQFNEPTAAELNTKLKNLEKQGIQALVLDLRFNPGGLLNSAVDVCGQFLPPNTTVVTTEGRDGTQRPPYRTSDDGQPHRTYPLAVLVNGGSASGAEIVAGALKDLNRAVIVGETTFGKGSVQSVIQLPDGSALRLTTAKYYTPSHVVIHEHGVSPTIRATMTAEQEKLLSLSRRAEFLEPEDQALLKDFHDTQLERAVDALRGVLIYARREKSAEPKTASN